MLQPVTTSLPQLHPRKENGPQVIIVYRQDGTGNDLHVLRGGALRERLLLAC